MASLFPQSSARSRDDPDDSVAASCDSPKKHRACGGNGPIAAPIKQWQTQLPTPPPVKWSSLRWRVPFFCARKYCPRRISMTCNDLGAASRIPPTIRKKSAGQGGNPVDRAPMNQVKKQTPPPVLGNRHLAMSVPRFYARSTPPNACRGHSKLVRRLNVGIAESAPGTMESIPALATRLGAHRQSGDCRRGRNCLE
jgi:hypothetical protein